jgi:D-aminopeptidase
MKTIRIVSRVLLTLIAPGLLGWSAVAAAPERPRAREAGVATGVLPVGPLNAITDVAGVRVGHHTLVEGEAIRTGVTVILPHSGNLYQEKVPAAIFVTNGFGKLTGISQVEELGTLETPIALTGTLSVWRVADALAEWVLEQPGNESVLSVNPVVGECNDGFLSDIRRRPVGRTQLRAALAEATTGPVLEGSVGAGTGTRCFGFKGGIGTSSRRLPGSLGGWTVGALVQSNFG